VDRGLVAVLHEAVGNKAYLLNFDHFCGFLKQVAESPLAASGFCTVVHEGPLVHVNLHLDWAIANKLVKLAAPLKGSYLAWRERKLATKEDFVHLHCHSEFSLLDGATAIDQVAMRAMLNGQPGIALTDHGYCFGSFKHWKACTDLGIKPLMGCEIYLVDDVNQKYVDDQGVTRRFEHHLTLIAMTQEGWANLCKMLTRGAATIITTCPGSIGRCSPNTPPASTASPDASRDPRPLPAGAAATGR